jgi:hypothetical protein
MRYPVLPALRGRPLRPGVAFGRIPIRAAWCPGLAKDVRKAGTGNRASQCSGLNADLTRYETGHPVGSWGEYGKHPAGCQPGLFYDFLMDEGLRESNSMRRGRYTPARRRVASSVAWCHD